MSADVKREFIGEEKKRRKGRGEMEEKEEENHFITGACHNSRGSSEKEVKDWSTRATMTA